MPAFSFDARDLDGRRVRGVESAASVAELDRALEQRKLVLVRAHVGGGRLGMRIPNSSRVLIDLCYHLATSIEAGVPLIMTLTDLQEDGKSPIAGILDDITRKVEAGQTLSQAIAAYPTLFPPLAVSLVSAGEQTGELPRILRDLVAYLQWTEDLRRKLKGALIYPCIVLVGMIGLVVLITTFVLPNFLDLFVELHVELPLVTRGMIWLHHFLTTWWFGLLVGAGALGLAFTLLLRNAAARFQLHRLLLELPLFGKLLTMIEMSRFAHNLSLLYGSGIPIVRGLEMVTEIVQNLVVREAVGKSVESVRTGATLTAALGESGLMPTLVMRMISLGERVGTLERSLDHVASYYDREVPGIVDRALAIFNAVLIASLGMMLTAIALGIFVPLYQMMGNLDAAP
jgi:type II secretory pathway component PulF